MQRGHHHLRGGNFFAIDVHGVYGNAAAVVDDGDRVVDVNGDFDFIGVAGESFIDGVVDHFVHQMMQTQFTGRADVHGGAQANRFHAAQHLDRIGGVVPVSSVDGGNPPVFLFAFRDGHVDFFGRHSAPWRTLV